MKTETYNVNILIDLQNYEFPLPENAGVNVRVGVVLAEDGDSGESGQVEYSISGDEADNFRIDRISVRNFKA